MMKPTVTWPSNGRDDLGIGDRRFELGHGELSLADIVDQELVHAGVQIIDGELRQVDLALGDRHLVSMRRNVLQSQVVRRLRILIVHGRLLQRRGLRRGRYAFRTPGDGVVGILRQLAGEIGLLEGNFGLHLARCRVLRPDDGQILLGNVQVGLRSLEASVEAALRGFEPGLGPIQVQPG